MPIDEEQKRAELRRALERLSIPADEIEERIDKIIERMLEEEE